MKRLGTALSVIDLDHTFADDLFWWMR